MSHFDENPGESNARLDALLGALADKQRRQTVWYFRSVGDGVVMVTELVDYTVADTSGGQTREQREMKLYHVTLPKLAEGGFVEWNEASNEVAKGPRFEEARRLLEFLVQRDEELLSVVPNDD